MRISPIHITTCLLLIIASLPLRAEVWKQYNVITKHYFSISAGGGYYSLLENIPEVTTRGGGAGMLGVNYEFRYSGFWFSVGADVQYGSSTLTMAPFEVHREMYDTQGKRVSYHYNIEEYSDTQRDFRVGVPVLFGFYTNGVYGGIGAKFSYAPHTVTTPAMTYTTSGTYERYLADFENMPNHFYTQYSVPGKTEVKMHPQGSVIAELGYDVLNKERMSNYALCSVLKVALYAEYGINSCTSGNAHDEIIYKYNPADPTQLIADSYYVRHNLEKARIVPFYVGVKVTFMLRIRTSNCRCYGPL
ncbi:MAG: hypothetical protein IJ204_00640 [Paludibacteraceae bacterium]|nr:hypothetical protein [Paludibacteraceae bacterium]